MNWYEISIYVEKKYEEQLLILLYDLDTNGFVIEDPSDKFYNDMRSDYGEFIDTTIKFDHEDLLIKVYFDKLNIETNLMTIKKYVTEKNIKNVKIRVNQIGDEWIEQWKNSLQPIELDDQIRIIPTNKYRAYDDDKINIKIEPGMAFGTGSHETTVLSIKFIEKYLKPNTTVFDIGCGSGILSIVANKLGAKAIAAIDIDEKAINVSSKNFEINNVQNVKLMHGNLLDVVHTKADLIVANILHYILIDLSKDIINYMTKDTIFISSGILNTKVEEVKTAYEKNGLEIIDEMIDGEWVVLAAKKRS